jgi:hypothetical protein
MASPSASDHPYFCVFTVFDSLCILTLCFGVSVLSYFHKNWVNDFVSYSLSVLDNFQKRKGESANFKLPSLSL